MNWGRALESGAREACSRTGGAPARRGGGRGAAGAAGEGASGRGRRVQGHRRSVGPGRGAGAEPRRRERGRV